MPTTVHIPERLLKRAAPVVRSRFSDIEPALSPDGRWLAYVSDESGQPEVYVQPFPDPGPRRQISTSGGREPLWAREQPEATLPRCP